jgi:hypothetical protein
MAVQTMSMMAAKMVMARTKAPQMLVATMNIMAT